MSSWAVGGRWACPSPAADNEHDAQVSAGRSKEWACPAVKPTPRDQEWACPAGENMFTRNEFLALALTEC